MADLAAPMAAPAQTFATSDLWLCVGLAGNAIFGARFLVQWIASERAGRSVVPPVFWWLSIGGSLIFLAYAVHVGLTAGWKLATPLLLSYAPNLVPYARNLVLLRREKLAAS